ncbi:hypothetical protein MnTg03_00367 [bacterium MnTg03]|nr:hypothetical protein MnTg03_00367 [bacterium MnTg03]
MLDTFFDGVCIGDGSIREQAHRGGNGTIFFLELKLQFPRGLGKKYFSGIKGQASDLFITHPGECRADKQNQYGKHRSNVNMQGVAKFAGLS